MTSQCFRLALLLLLLFFEVKTARTSIKDDREEDSGLAMMANDELDGLFDVMGALLGDRLGWAQDHPEPCTETPWPGVECEVDADAENDKSQVFHVTKIRIGPDSVSSCDPDAHFSESLPKLQFLRTLSIFNCFCHSPVTLSPTLLGALTSLEHLSLQSNPALSGQIPASLGGINGLRILSLKQNSLNGGIPSEIGNLVGLQLLDLSYNNLSSDIPVEVGGIKSLAILALSFNALTGYIPSSLGHLQLLQKLDLSYNRLSGTIPPPLANSNRLVLLDLSHNSVSGPIPETLTGLTRLEHLALNQNPLNSPMPSFVRSLKRLKSISFSSCGLTGPVPKSLSLLQNLTSLSLDNNKLSGAVPAVLGSLHKLGQLNLSQNQLSGEIYLPREFVNRLGKRLDLRGNRGLRLRTAAPDTYAHNQTQRCHTNETTGDRACSAHSKGIRQPLSYARSLDLKLISLPVVGYVLLYLGLFL